MRQNELSWTLHGAQLQTLQRKKGNKNVKLVDVKERRDEKSVSDSGTYQCGTDTVTEGTQHSQQENEGLQKGMSRTKQYQGSVQHPCLGCALSSCMFSLQCGFLLPELNTGVKG